MNNVPIVTLCVAPNQQNDTFDARVTGVTNPESLTDLRTQLEAAGYQLRKREQEAEGVYLCTVGCASGEILDDKDTPLITRAVEAAGMEVAA